MFLTMEGLFAAAVVFAFTFGVLAGQLFTKKR